MTPYRHMLSNFRNTDKRTVNAAGKTSFSTHGIGNMKVTVPHGGSDGSTVTYTLKDVLYAPDMSATLVSLGKFDDAGLRMGIGNGHFDLYLCSGAHFFSVPKVRGLYRVYHDDAAYSVEPKKILLYDLHKHLGHASYKYASKR
jgi:hypothetical protein